MMKLSEQQDNNNMMMENIPQSDNDEMPIAFIEIPVEIMTNDQVPPTTEDDATLRMANGNSGYSVVSHEEDMAQMSQVLMMMEPTDEDLYLPLDVSERDNDDNEIEMLVPFLDTLQSLLGEPLVPSNPMDDDKRGKVVAIKAGPTIEKRRAILAGKGRRVPFAFQCHRKS